MHSDRRTGVTDSMQPVIPETMTALVKERAEAGDFVLKTGLPVPEPGDDEVLIKVHCTAICGTDMHIMEWDRWSQLRVKTPFVPGHETAGVIVKTGKNVTDRKVGDRVSCETHIPCGDCWFCRNGMPHICSNVRLFGATEDGAFAEYAKIRSDSTFVIGDSISYEMACMFEPLGAGVHGVEAAEVQGKTVLVSGCGPIGLTAVSACKTFGAEMVIACDLADDRLEMALDMGADHVINSGRQDLRAEVLRLTGGIGADAAIDITGSGAAIRAGLNCVRAAGKMVCVGLPVKNVELDLTNELIYREISLTGISGRLIWKTWEDFAQVMQGPYFRMDHIMGQKFALRDYKKAFELIRSGVPGKMILYPDERNIK